MCGGGGGGGEKGKEGIKIQICFENQCMMMVLMTLSIKYVDSVSM